MLFKIYDLNIKKSLSKPTPTINFIFPITLATTPTNQHQLRSQAKTATTIHSINVLSKVKMTTFHFNKHLNLVDIFLNNTNHQNSVCRQAFCKLEVLKPSKLSRMPSKGRKSLLSTVSLKIALVWVSGWVTGFNFCQTKALTNKKIYIYIYITRCHAE